LIWPQQRHTVYCVQLFLQQLTGREIADKTTEKLAVATNGLLMVTIASVPCHRLSQDAVGT